MEVARERIHRIPGIRVPEHGGIGCARSHIAALELALEKGWETVCVLEDDFCWTLGQEAMDARWQDLRDRKWDLLLLSTTVEVCQVAGHGWYRVEKSRNSTGYITRRGYIPVLIKNFRESSAKLLRDPSRYAEFALDQYWNRLQRKDMWLMPDPRPGITRDDMSSIDPRMKSDSFGMKGNLAAVAKPAEAKTKAWSRPLKPLSTRGKLALPGILSRSVL